jgi:hypothetical protein
VLDESPGIAPATLPTPGLLDPLDLGAAWFTAVGYGEVRTDKTKGPQTIEFGRARRFATENALQLGPTWLLTDQNIADGNGGRCFADDGGPHLLRDTDTVVALSEWGDQFCRAVGWNARIDTALALDFIGRHVSASERSAA